MAGCAVRLLPDGAAAMDSGCSIPDAAKEIRTLETIALTPHLGVQILGVDNLLDDTDVGRCKEALKWRGVLLIRGLHLDDAGQLAFSRTLGRVLAPGGREIYTVSLDKSKNPQAEYLKGTFHWHIDDTTSDVPPRPPC